MALLTAAVEYDFDVNAGTIRFYGRSWCRSWSSMADSIAASSMEKGLEK